MSTPEKDLIVGGQAVIEGVMMRTPNAYAIAVRKADGSIVHTAASLPKLSASYPILNLPILRGAATLVQSMSLGVRALNYSASQALDAAETVEGKELAYQLTPAVAEGEGEFAAVTGAIPGLTPFARKSKDKSTKKSASIAGSIFFALIFNVLLFIVAPLLLTNILFIAAGWANAPAITAPNASISQTSTPSSDSSAIDKVSASVRTFTGRYLHPVRPSVAFNLVDGIIRMIFFLIMIVSFSWVKDIRRVFEYHGAEHKTVFTWESGLPLTVENARPQPRQHPRCGTSFLMVVMLVSIALFSVIKFDSLMLNMVIRIVLMPVVAGLSYEIIRLSAKREGSPVFKLLTLPGVWLQNITTKEPDDSQLEVAIYALQESLKFEPRPDALEASPAPLA